MNLIISQLNFFTINLLAVIFSKLYPITGGTKVQLKKGNSRIIMLLPALGIVIKLPRIRLRYFWLDFQYHLQKKNQVLFWRWFFNDIFGSSFHLYGPKALLFRGICCNLLEFWVCLRYRDPVFVPTYFSFFGLFNIQKFVVIAGDADAQFAAKLKNALGSYGENLHDQMFTFDRGQWKIVHYCTPGFVKNFLVEHKPNLSKLPCP